MKKKQTRELAIQYPDGRFHTIRVHKFYSVLLHGKEEFVVEYDDLTDNKRNCFAVLDRENNIFVKRPLKDQKAYSDFYDSIKYMLKKPYDLDVLPNTINLCKPALEGLKVEAQRKNPYRTATQAQILVYRDIGPNHSSFPYYLDADTARYLGFRCYGSYYHLTEEEFNNLKSVYGIAYREINISPKQEITVFKDVGTNHDMFPYYLEGSTATYLGFSPVINGYYHLTSDDLSRLERVYLVKYVSKVLNLGRSNEFGGNGFVSRNGGGVILGAAGGSGNPPGGGNGSPGNILVTVLEDIAAGHDTFPYYLDSINARKVGLSVDSTGYRHLTPSELNSLKVSSIVRYEQRLLYLGERGIKFGVSHDRELTLIKPQTKKRVVIYVDAAKNHDEFPFYVDAVTAMELGYIDNTSAYYHLTNMQLDKIKKDYDVRFMNVYLGLGVERSLEKKKPLVSKPSTGAVSVTTRKSSSANLKRQVVIYVDVAKVHDGFPFYLDSVDAVELGFIEKTNAYYHLNEAQLEKIKVSYNVRFMNVHLGFGSTGHELKKTGAKTGESIGIGVSTKYAPPTLEKPVSGVDLGIVTKYAPPAIEPAVEVGISDTVVTKYAPPMVTPAVSEGAISGDEFLGGVTKYAPPMVPPVHTVGPLTEAETDELENLFDKLMNFEDYYSFFEIEDLRNASEEEILGDYRIIRLTELFKRGVESGNDLAIHFSEFMVGFKESIKGKSKIK